MAFRNVSVSDRTHDVIKCYDINEYTDIRKIDKIEEVFRKINSFISKLDIPIAEFHFSNN